MTGFACKQTSAMIAPLFLGLQAIKGYEALQQRHKMDVHTYFHLVPLLVAELRPPTAAALPLRLLATMVHAKAHARAWAAMHAGWLRELPRRESHKVRRAVVFCVASFALHLLLYITGSTRGEHLHCNRAHQGRHRSLQTGDREQATHNHTYCITLLYYTIHKNNLPYVPERVHMDPLVEVCLYPCRGAI
jgi:hypothetical protein